LEFKRDFDFLTGTWEHRGPKNRGFANIAGAHVQHDGNVSCASLSRVL